MLLRYLFGDDIFISYSRKDGKPYATKLKEQLGSMDYSCFIDFEKVYPGDNLSRRLQRALRRSRVLVLVGTEGARQSPYVRQEIDEFLKTGRALIPIDVRDALVNPQWDVLTANELVWIDESRQDAPSPEVFEEIRRLFKFNRRNVWVRASITAAALVLLTISVIAVLMAVRARASQLEAERQTEALKLEQQKVRDQTEQLRGQTEQLKKKEEELTARNKELEGKNEELKEKTGEAERERKAAQENAARARRQEQAALRNAELARQQQQLANERQQLAFSRELASNAISRLPFDPELSVLLAENAMNVSHTREAEDALRQSLAAYPARIALGNFSDPEHVAEFSPDGRLIVTTGFQNRARVWDAGTGERLTEFVAPLAAPGDARVSSVKFSPDNKYVAGGRLDGLVHVWDVGTGSLLKTLSGHGGRVYDIVFSPDGKCVATASGDGTARVWDVGTGRSVTLGAAGDPGVKRVRFSPDGGRVAAAGEDTKVRVWDAKTGEVKNVFDATAAVGESVEFSPDGRLLAFASSQGVAQLHDLATGAKKELGGYYGPVSSVSFSRDGKLLVTTAASGTTRIWQADAAAEGFVSEIPEGGSSARFSPDGRLLLITNAEGNASHIWDVDAQRLAAVLRGGGVFVSAEFSPDGRTVLTTDTNGTARVWKANRRRGSTKIETNIFLDAVFSPDGSLIASAHNGLGIMAHLIDANTGKVSKVLSGSTGSVTALGFSPDGKRVLTGSDGVIVIWDTTTGAETKTLSAPGGFVKKAEFSRDGKLIVSVGEDRKARLWDVGTGSSVELGHDGPVSDAEFSRDGRHLVTAGQDRTVRVWDVSTKQLVKTLGGHADAVAAAAFSPDGKFVATVGFNTAARVWQVETGKFVEMQCGRNAFSVEFSADGRHLLTQVDFGRARPQVCDAATDIEVMLQDLPRYGISFSALSPDGLFLLGSDLSGEAMRVWELATGRVAVELRGVRGPFAVSADGSSVLVKREGGDHVYPWEALAPVEDLLKAARRATTRVLSPEEEKDYLHK